MSSALHRTVVRALTRVLLVACLLPASGWAIEAINRIKETGRLKVAVRSVPSATTAADRELLRGLAESLGAELELHRMTGHADLLEALTSGQVDLIGDPMAVRRPFPAGLQASLPVRHADLWLVGSAIDHSGGLGVQFGSDGWHQAIQRRGRLDGFDMRVAPATLSTDELLQRVAQGQYGGGLAYAFDLDAAGRDYVGLKPIRRIEDQVALGWVTRSRDRVLRYRVNQFLQNYGLTRDLVFEDRGDWDRIVERGRIRLVTLYRPETYFAWSGQLMGLDYEMARSFARHHGLELDVVLASDHQDLADRLARGEADIGAALLSGLQHPSLAQSMPYFGDSGVLVTRSGRVAEFQPDHLQGRSLLLPQDSPWMAAVRDWQQAGIEITIRPQEGSDPIQQVVSGAADFALVDRFRLQLETDWQRSVEGVHEIEQEQPRYWVFRRDNPDLGGQIDAYWSRARRGLEYNLIVNKYFGGESASKPFRAAFLAYNRDHALSPYDDLVRRYSGYYDFDWRLILAVMFQESRFDPDAVSVSGARGLMQVKSVAARQVGIEDVTDPRQGIHAGIKYLAWLRDRFEADLDVRDRLWFSLAAYNGGLTHVRSARAEAERMGLDSRRWFGNVERGLHSLKQRGAHRFDEVDVDQIVGYVSRIRDRYRSYQRLTVPLVDESRRIANRSASPANDRPTGSRPATAFSPMRR